MDKQIAYSTLEIKAMTEVGGMRKFSGVATTPTPDRSGDIVDPKGAEFQLPIPLLWHHDSHQPIGWVRSARVTAKGIEVDCEMASIDEPGMLKNRLDEAWQSLKAKLVGGLSIGFKPLEAARIGDTYSYRFMKWLWLELSAVTVAANGDCSITQIKTADQTARRSMYGAHGARTGVGHVTGKSGSPDVSGIHRASRPFFIPE